MENNGDVQREAVTWECCLGQVGHYDKIQYIHQGYGMIEPVYMEGLNRYHRGMCPCERQAVEQNRRLAAKEARARTLEAHRRNTFGWLGKSWADVGLEGKTFAAFEQHRQPGAFALVQKWLDVLAGTLILYGPFGTGKTHLLAALCNALHERDRACLFASSVKLFSAIQDLVGRNESYVSLLSRAMCTPLFVLDDVDKAKPTDFRQEVYFAIIDERTRRNLPTAISTNRLAELESFVGGAVCSRLKIGRIAIEMTGSDYRAEL